MHQPAIQAALANLVEVIRTALTAEFLEFSRGEAKPVGGKLGRGGAKKKSKAAKKAPRKAAKKAPAKGAGKRAAK